MPTQNFNVKNKHFLTSSQALNNTDSIYLIFTLQDHNGKDRNVVNFQKTISNI